jgi:coenzyme F420-reducing hydrogenase delta subunit
LSIKLKIDNKSLFIGFISEVKIVTNGDDETESDPVSLSEVNDAFNNIAQDYKENFISKIKEYGHIEQLDSFGELFNFKAYRTLGEFDYLLLCLTNDISFGTKELLGYSNRTVSSGNYPVGFKHQNYIGYHLYDDVSLSQDAIQSASLALVSVTLLKINNAILLSNNPEELFLKLHKKIEEKLNGIKYTLTYSYGWNEITLICFSNSIVELKDKIFTIRELDISEIIDKDFDCYLTKHIGDTSLTSYHFFCNSTSYFAYDEDLIDSIKHEENIEILSKVFVKPGHIQNFGNIISPNIPLEVVSGKGVALLKSKSLKEYHQQVIIKCYCTSNIRQHLRRVISRIIITGHEVDSCDIELGKFSLINNLSFKHKEIVEIRTKLKELNFSVVTTTRFIKCLDNFNKGIKDVALYIYFIDFKSFLDHWIFLIKENKETNLTELKRNVEKAINYFDHAFWAIYFHSYNFNDVSDVYAEYAGGMQQILLTYNSLIKKTYHLPVIDQAYFNEHIAFVSGNSGVDIRKNVLKLNFNHLFYPELFLSSYLQEQLNLGYIDIDLNIDFFEFNEVILPSTTFDSKAKNLQLAKSAWSPKDSKFLLKRLANSVVTSDLHVKNERKEEIENFLYCYSDTLWRKLLVETFSLKLNPIYKNNFEIYWQWQWISFLNINHVLEIEGTLGTIPKIKILDWYQMATRMTLLAKIQDLSQDKIIGLYRDLNTILKKSRIKEIEEDVYINYVKIIEELYSNLIELNDEDFLNKLNLEIDKFANVGKMPVRLNCRTHPSLYIKEKLKETYISDKDKETCMKIKIWALRLFIKHITKITPTIDASIKQSNISLPQLDGSVLSQFGGFYSLSIKKHNELHQLRNELLVCNYWHSLTDIYVRLKNMD